MNFLTPLAFAFAASIPVVIVFYLLKRKRVVRLVSSTMLWQKFLADTQASAPFQKLRHNWLLFLQILLLLLVVLALARPYFSGEAKRTKLQVVILDGSASMQATDEKPSRFDKAREEALGLVDGMRDGEQMMLLLAGARTEVKLSPTSDKATLRNALESSKPADVPTRLVDALKTASAFTFEKQGEEEVTSGEIHLFSDGVVPELDKLENQNLPLVYHKIGIGGRNMGITALDVRANPENPAQRAIYVSVANFSSNAMQAALNLKFDNDLVAARPLNIPAGETSPQVFIADQIRDGVFTAQLEIDDDLKVDDRASIVSLMPQPVKVLLVTGGNRFLENALRAVPSVRLSVAESLTDDAGSFDLVVLDDVTPIGWPEKNLLAIHTMNTNWFSGWSRVENPAIVDWKATHPVMRYISFDNVFVAEGYSVQKPDWGVSLMESQQTPLIIAGELNQRRIVWVGFDTLSSTWPLRVSFPIFIANAVDWLNPASVEAEQLMVRGGSAFQMKVNPGVTSAQVTRPDRSRIEVKIEPDRNELSFGDTLRQGVYRVSAGTNETAFTVNLLDGAESRIQPQNELPMGRYEQVAATGARRASVEIWRWIVLAGLVLLMFEWWWYHKRTV